MNTIVLADATLPGLDKHFTLPFTVKTYGNSEELQQQMKQAEVLLCRSTLKVNAELIHATPLKIVATASSGVDHIDRELLQQKNITLVDAKGCNAQSVGDYVLSCLAWLYKRRNFTPRKAGVIGVGEVGRVVCQRLKALGCLVLPFDPLRARDEADFISCDFETLVDCDLLCIHAELHERPPYPSKNLLNADFLKRLNPNTVMINAARGEIVNEAALLQLQNPPVYCTDVYANEPNPCPEIIQLATLCTPHIAGHSIEGKENAVVMAAEKIYRFYGLEFPTPSPRPILPAPEMSSCSHWQDKVLALYNPENETRLLKANNRESDYFKQLRKRHCFRHDFNCYDNNSNATSLSEK